MDISVLGIDTAKDVFELCGLNHMGRVIYRRRVRRKGFLREYGIVLSRGISKVRHLPELLEQHGEKFSALSRELFSELYEEFVAVDAQVTKYDGKLEKLARSHPVCRKLMLAKGIGPVTATALVSSVGNAQEFKNGRGFSAWIGLVPRQRSSGDQRRLGRITKRGDDYLRQLLVHGARSVVLHSKNRSDRMSMWIRDLIQRRGFNKAVVAVANKNARIVWVLLAKDEPYRPQLAAA